MVLLVLVLLAGIVPPASAGIDYWVNITAVNTTSWTDMTMNIVTIRDSMLPSNISMAISASSTNISALRGNGTVVMNNGTAVPYYNLTTSFSRITVTGTQSLNFTTAGAGTYLVTANIRENTTVTAPQQLSVFTEYALCDGTGTTIVTNSERMGSRVQDTGNFSAVARSFSWVYTNSTGATNVAICGKISTAVAGRYAIASDGDGRSVLNYIKLA